MATTTALAILTGVLAAPQAAQADDATAPPDRSQVVSIWLSGGSTVRPAAEAALLGTDDDVRAFLAQVGDLQAVDDRITVNQVAAAGGPSVRQVAEAALDSGDIAGFLDTGWQDAVHADQRLHVNQLIAAGGPNVRAAGEKALDADAANPPRAGATTQTPGGVLDDFIGSGWQDTYYVDQRIHVNQIAAGATEGSNVKRMAERALDGGTIDDLDGFLDSGWAVAAAWDEETNTIKDLVASAERASSQATQENETAKDQAAKAGKAAADAKTAAEAALAAMNDAASDLRLAQSAAKRAASAARNAESAAQQAISASNAAVSAARQSARAAARAAAVAALTQKAANDANKAAAKAAVNKADSQSAKDLAILASAAALKAKDAASALTETITAAVDAENTAKAANAAVTNAKLAEAAATKALKLAKQTGVDVAEAEAAAARAHNEAVRADRAAAASEAFAEQAHTAAIVARNAALSAADEATQAAQYANDAAAHAGDAALAAQASTQAANAASVDADAAVNAANQAYAIYDAARAVDAARLEVAADENEDQAKDALAAYQKFQQQKDWDDEEAAKRDSTTQGLIAAVRSPLTDPAVALADARQVALTLSQLGGPNTQEAAREALGSADDFLLGFVRTGLDRAAAQDDRESVTELMMTGTTARYAAAQAALDGTDADVRAFLQNQDYPERSTEDRVTANQVVAAAKKSGRTTVVAQGEQALDQGGAAIRQFIEVGQFDAAETDDRIAANQIMAGAPEKSETWYSARNALDGPPGALHQFVESGQYVAARDDADAAAHDQEMLTLLKRAANAAATATRSAQEAQSVAAGARGDAASAAAWTQKAADSAVVAAGYASAATTAAHNAETSANQAAASAKKAAQAAKAADAAAADADRSAAAAEVSYGRAREAAASADRAAKRAYDAATAAGANAKAAYDARDQAYQQYKTFADNDAKAARTELFAKCMEDSGPFDSLQKNCYQVYSDDKGMMAARATLNRTVCERFANLDQKFYRNCVADSLNPNFQFNRALDVAQAMSTLIGETSKLDAMLFALGALAVGCAEVCGAGLAVFGGAEASMGVGGLFDVWAEGSLLRYVSGVSVASAGELISKLFDDVLGKVRLPAILERVVIPEKILDSNFAKMMAEILPRCLTGLPNSFSAGTRVLLADGGSKPIEDVAVGERVLATDPGTGVSRPEPVQQLITGTGSKDLVDVAVTGAGAVTATANHPFWVADLGQWRNAGDLQVGQWLRTGSGSWAQITALHRHTERTSVFNLGVARLHTYYVLAGATSLLVHNESKCDVALGVNDDGKLVDWARRHGFTHYMQSKDWKHDVQKAVGDADGFNIHVNTDGFDPLRGYTGNPTIGRFVQAIFGYIRSTKNYQTVLATQEEMFWLIEEVYWAGREGKAGRPNWSGIHLYDENDHEVAIPKDFDLWNLVRDFGGNEKDQAQLQSKYQRKLDYDRWEKENP